ncbi:MAG: hypothetical protein OEV69_07430 [Gammaproteobacteria bacterium]|nr:hypothetical protein [Gammaproteobacteria bacterium]
MPAPFGDGGPFVLCPHGLPHEVFGGQHQHHGSGDETRDTTWDSCSFGASTTVYAVGGEQQVAPVISIGVAAPTIVTSGVVAITILPFQSRAPPAIQS